MVLPVGIGIYGRVLACVVAPFVYLALREAGSLSVGYQTGILNFHEIGIVCHEVQAFGHFFKRHIAAICNS